jgi:ABC-2 type transport system ATP-binding protein
MSASAEVVLAAENLTKRFGDREAVSDVSFEVRAGEVFGFLGPNGAGKTTTIRMLVGLARPDRGRVRIRGLDITQHFTRAMAHVGAIVEAPDLYRYLTGRENLEHFARMLPTGARGRIDELAGMVALSGRLDDKVSTYSLGMRQRLGIAQALLGEPDVLILDEPANGLDPAGIREIRQLVRRLATERGIGVFVSSHLLSEIEQTADRVAIIHRGRTLAEGPVRELSARAGSDQVRVRARPAGRAAETLSAFGPVESVPAESDGENGVVVARIPPERVPEALRALLSAGIEVFTVERPSSTLEEVFLDITGGETV